MEPIVLNNRKSDQAKKKRLAIIVAVVTLILFLAFVLLITFVALPLLTEDAEAVATSGVLEQGVAAVVTEHAACSEAARELLAEGGSATDAALGAFFCLGVAQPHLAGLGGGFLMLRTAASESHVLDARETAPAAADDSALLPNASGAAVAVPGGLRGAWKAHKQWGKLPWKRLLVTAVALARDGVKVSAHLAAAILKRGVCQKEVDMGLQRLFCHTVGNPLKEGDTLRQPQLAQFLEAVRAKGDAALYEGSTLSAVVAEIAARGGVMSEDDLRSYQVKMRSPLRWAVGEEEVLSVPRPGGGAALSLASQMIQNLSSKMTNPWKGDITAQGRYYHYLVEAEKFAFAARSHLEDSNEQKVGKLEDAIVDGSRARQLVARVRNKTLPVAEYDALSSPELMGTAQIGVVAPSGEAISLTASVNYYFGAMLFSEATGLLYNNHMWDFSKKGEVNRIKPGRRPMSSMCPSVVMRGNNVSYVIGGSGGMYITSAVTQVLSGLRWLDMQQAVEQKRLHPEIEENLLRYEPGFNTAVLRELKDRGHVISDKYRGASVLLLHKSSSGQVSGFGDPRRGGVVRVLESIVKDVTKETSPLPTPDPGYTIASL